MNMNLPFGLLIRNGVQSSIATTVGHSGNVPVNLLQLFIECQVIYFGTK